MLKVYIRYSIFMEEERMTEEDRYPIRLVERENWEAVESLNSLTKEYDE